MADYDQLREVIMARLRAAARVDRDSALGIARNVLAANPREAQQFEAWFKVNGAQLVRIING